MEQRICILQVDLPCIIDDFRDLDVFTTNSKDAINQIRDNNTIDYYISDHSITFNTIIHTEYPVSDYELKYHKYGRGSAQLIFREYMTPSEIVHGFDLDCCGYIYDVTTDKLYRTKRAAYSTKIKINFFDPTRSSPSYASRLSKYNLRGFNIWIPFSDRVIFNEKLYQQTLSDIYNENKKNILDFYLSFSKFNKYKDDFEYTITSKDKENMLYISKEINIDENEAENIIILIKELESRGLDIARQMKILGWPSLVDHQFPHDPFTIIVLAIFKSLYLSEYESDYTNLDFTERYTVNRSIFNKNMLKDIKWETVDPMKQLSGTFYPEPIVTDLLDWYSQSSFVNII